MSSGVSGDAWIFAPAGTSLSVVCVHRVEHKHPSRSNAIDLFRTIPVSHRHRFTLSRIVSKCECDKLYSRATNEASTVFVLMYGVPPA